MRTRRYMRMEQAIASGDGGTIYTRWRYGRLLLNDDTATTPAGHLRHGVMDLLLARASGAGFKLSATEVRRRIQCGRTYETEPEINQILADFENWWQLIQAGFPAVERSAEAEPYDPRDTAETERDGTRQLRRARDEAWQQMLPGFHTMMTLGEMDKRIHEKRELGQQLVREADELQPMLDELLDAVGGDRSATYDEARDALNGETDDSDTSDDLDGD